MHRIVFLLTIILLFSTTLFAQVVSLADTVIQLQEAVVKGYISEQPLLQTPTSVGIVTNRKLRTLADESLLPAINSIPGVRMEERSPGSYRLSVRGSLLRSPWGVRNVKVYMDEFPLTDAGGNTYLNLIDMRSINRIEVLKGPHGSLFGANSGGVVLVDPVGQQPDSSRLKFGISSGSYGMVHQNASLQQRHKTSQFNLDQAFQRSDGYRENSAMRRHYLQASERWSYRPGSALKALAFYSNLHYRTPGGLNEAQYLKNPRQARQAAGPNPGAVEQQAGIENETIFGGLSHEAQITPMLRHVVSVFGSRTHFENPFITNYEVRDENNYGTRTYVELKSKGAEDLPLDWRWNLGLEWQRSGHEISNFDNIGNATRGNLQASDEIRTNQHFYFTRFSANFFERLTAEAAISLNYYKYAFVDLSGGTAAGKSDFSPEWMPRLSFSYLLTPYLSWRGSVSRGYSSPTTAEIRPSNIVINTELEAETGWNQETGLRYMSRNNRFQVDASVFYYRMQKAIVRRLDEGGAEFFINAGGTKQLGFESAFTSYLIEPRQNGFIRGLQLNNSFTFSDFKFEEYIQDSDDFTGNRLTGVPYSVVVSSLTFDLPESFSVFAQHNYTDRIPLDDANSVYADSYHLVQAKMRWQKSIRDQYRIELFAGVDNLLNEKYSLGNDINAYGGRFFNAAPLRSFFGGISITL